MSINIGPFHKIKEGKINLLKDGKQINLGKTKEKN